MSRMLRAMLGVLAGLAATTGCDMGDMYDQPRYEDLEASSFFADGQSARQPVAGTIARGQLPADQAAVSGKDAEGKYLVQPPMDVNRALLVRGRERFDIYCSVCHGRTGIGNGMIVQRGFRRPPSLHVERLRQAPAGHFFDVITHGFGAMPAYANRIPVPDRWAIVAYVRALQFSQHAELQDLPAPERTRLEDLPP